MKRLARSKEVHQKQMDALYGVKSTRQRELVSENVSVERGGRPDADKSILSNQNPMSSHLSNHDDKAKTQNMRTNADVFSHELNTIPNSAVGGPRVVKRAYNHRKIKNGFTLYPSNKQQIRFIHEQKATER